MTSTWLARPHGEKSDRGFTFIEMIVVLGILSVLAVVGVPALQRLVQATSLASASTELHAAAARARQEAITRGTFVTITPQTAGDWTTGYQTFVNPLNSPSFASGQSVGTGTSVVTSEIIAKGEPTTWRQITWPSSASDSSVVLAYMTFDNIGRPRNVAGRTRVRMCVATGACKELVIDALGRIQIQSF